MFTRPVVTMILISGLLMALTFWNVNDTPPDKVEVPDLRDISKSMR